MRSLLQILNVFNNNLCKNTNVINLKLLSSNIHYAHSMNKLTVTPESSINLKHVVAEQPKRRLIAFDFDHTIVNENTDLVVRDLIDPKLIPDNVKLLYKSSGWTSYMQGIFQLLYKYNVKETDITKAIIGIPEVPGMRSLITSLQSINFDVIIISDSNLNFINSWLKENTICSINSIYSNPAKFNDSGLLEIKPFHHQLECKLSTINLCKGKILDDYITEMYQTKQIVYENVFYVGDGYNDLCPILRLRNIDFGCVRLGMDLHNKIQNILDRQKTDDLYSKLKAQLIYWNNGYELLDKILQEIKS